MKFDFFIAVLEKRRVNWWKNITGILHFWILISLSVLWKIRVAKNICDYRLEGMAELVWKGSRNEKPSKGIHYKRHRIYDLVSIPPGRKFLFHMMNLNKNCILWFMDTIQWIETSDLVKTKIGPENGPARFAQAQTEYSVSTSLYCIYMDILN